MACYGPRRSAARRGGVMARHGPGRSAARAWHGLGSRATQRGGAGARHGKVWGAALWGGGPGVRHVTIRSGARTAARCNAARAWYGLARDAAWGGGMTRHGSWRSAARGGGMAHHGPVRGAARRGEGMARHGPGRSAARQGGGTARPRAQRNAAWRGHGTVWDAYAAGREHGMPRSGGAAGRGYGTRAARWTGVARHSAPNTSAPSSNAHKAGTARTRQRARRARAATAPPPRRHRHPSACGRARKKAERQRTKSKQQDMHSGRASHRARRSALPCPPARPAARRQRARHNETRAAWRGTARPAQAHPYCRARRVPVAPAPPERHPSVGTTETIRATSSLVARRRPDSNLDQITQIEKEPAAALHSPPRGMFWVPPKTHCHVPQNR